MTFNWDAYVTDKQRKHRYAEWYDKYLFELRNTIHGQVVEIGCKEGSARLWLDYFEKAKVVGADIRPVLLKAPRFEYFKFNQFSGDSHLSLLSTYENIQVVIDDGPHSAKAQMKSLQYLLPHLGTDTWYIIEDLHYQRKSKRSDISTIDLVKEWRQGIFKEHLFLPFPEAIQNLVLDIYIEQARLSEIVFIHKR